MNNAKLETKDELLGSAWNYVADLGGGQQVSVAFGIAKDATKESVDAHVDKIRAVMDRQRAKSAVLSVEHELEQLEMRHKSAVDDLARIDGKHEAKGGATTLERTQRENATVTISSMAKDLEYKKSVLAKLKDEAK